MENYNYILVYVDQEEKESFFASQVPCLKYDARDERDQGLEIAQKLRNKGNKIISCTGFRFKVSISKDELKGVYLNDPKHDHVKQQLSTINVIIPIDPVDFDAQEIIEEVLSTKTGFVN